MDNEIIRMKCLKAKRIKLTRLEKLIENKELVKLFLKMPAWESESELIMYDKLTKLSIRGFNWSRANGMEIYIVNKYIGLYKTFRLALEAYVEVAEKIEEYMADGEFNIYEVIIVIKQELTEKRFNEREEKKAAKIKKEVDYEAREARAKLKRDGYI